MYALDENGVRISSPDVTVRRGRKRRVFAADENVDRTPNPPKEVIADLLWVVVTAVVDHHAIERSLADARKIGRLAAELLYRHIDLERQVRSQSGQCSHWQTVDAGPTMRILENVPEVDEEKTPEELRIGSLVDPLPSLKAGVWSGVDVDRFVPIVHVEEPRQQPGLALGLMRGGGPARVDADVPPLLLSRQLDFTVEPGRTYRYRARLVVDDDRWRRKDGAGPWSEPTDAVTVPSTASDDRSIRKAR